MSNFAPHAPRNWAWQQCLPASQKLVLLAIAEAGDANGVTFMGQVNISDGACIPERTLRRRLGELEAEGLIVRYRRDRENGSRTSDLIVLCMPRDAQLYLRDYARVRERIGDSPAPEIAQIVEIDLPANSGRKERKPTGQNGSDLPANMLAGPEELGEELDKPPTPLLEDEDDRRARGLMDWYTDQLKTRRGRPVPTNGHWLRAAREVVVGREGAEIRTVVLWGLDRGWWYRKINTLPKLVQAYPDLRADWAGEQHRLAERNGGDDHRVESSSGPSQPNPLQQQILAAAGMPRE